MLSTKGTRSLKFLVSHLSDDFAEVAGDGNVYHRSDVEAGWSDVTLKDYKLSDCMFKLITSDAAYVNCKMELDATYKGQPFPRRFRVTWVWTRQNGSWVIRFEQRTIIPEQSKIVYSSSRLVTLCRTPAPGAPLFASFVAPSRNFSGFSMGAQALRLPSRDGEGDLPGGEFGAPRFDAARLSALPNGRQAHAATPSDDSRR